MLSPFTVRGNVWPERRVHKKSIDSSNRTPHSFSIAAVPAVHLIFRPLQNPFRPVNVRKNALKNGVKKGQKPIPPQKKNPVTKP